MSNDNLIKRLGAETMTTIDPKVDQGLVCHGCNRLILFHNWLVSEMDMCPSCGVDFDLKIIVEAP